MLWYIKSSVHVIAQLTDQNACDRNSCNRYLRPEAKSSEASTEVVGMRSVYGTLRHDDLEKSAPLHHWWIISVLYIFSYIAQIQVTRDAASKVTKAQRKLWKTDVIHNDLKWQVKVMIVCKHTSVYCKQATTSFSIDHKALQNNLVDTRLTPHTHHND